MRKVKLPWTENEIIIPDKNKSVLVEYHHMSIETELLRYTFFGIKDPRRQNVIVERWVNPRGSGNSDQQVFHLIPISSKLTNITNYLVKKNYTPIRRINNISSDLSTGTRISVTSELFINDPFQKGDIVTYQGAKFACEDQKGGIGYITKGAILRIILKLSDKIIDVKCIGNVNESLLGSQVRLQRGDLTLFEYAYIEKGKKVEIITEVIFRKQDLKGQKALVVLSTDQDGDVGLQFEKIGRAGNLDGAGKDGKCLYIFADALKVSE